MTDGWIKVRKCLFRHPKVMRIANQTGLCEEHVVGWLMKVWAWADDITADGNVDGVTHGDVVRVTGAPGKLLASMQSVGWLVQTTEGIVFPDYEQHMSNNAKKRALTARRVAKHKANKGNAASVTGALPREEKSREEKNKEDILRPSVAEVSVYCEQRGNAVDPKHFVDYYTARDWKLKDGNDMKDWQAVVRTWEKNQGIQPGTEQAAAANAQRAKDYAANWKKNASRPRT